LVDQRVEKLDQGPQLVRVDVVDLIDAEDKRLVAEARELGQRKKDLGNLLLIPKHDPFLAAGSQTEGAGDVGVDFVSREPSDRFRGQVSPGGIRCFLRSCVP
jgi:hypothetical protein